VFWYRYDWRSEVDVNRELIREAWDRYGASSAFAGWYLPHETADSSLRIIDINGSLAEEIRTLTPQLPILVSPFFFGRSDLWNGSDRRSKPREPDEHVRVWAEIFDRYSGLVDYCAFQDGTVDLLRVEEYLEATAAAARSAGITPWVNIEVFDRDMPIKFPPIDWRLLAHKIHAAQRHADKLISFELAHFISPHSMWPSARHLHQRYREFVGTA
jgi:hypothetical protein